MILLSMNKHTLIVLALLLATFSNAQSGTKEELKNDLIGTWVRTDSPDDEVFKFVKSKELKENVRGFIFHEGGTVILYEEFGCQLPPNFKPWTASWEVKSNKVVIIDRHYPGEKPQRMKIKKINGRALKFVWD